MKPGVQIPRPQKNEINGHNCNVSCQKIFAPKDILLNMGRNKFKPFLKSDAKGKKPLSSKT
jgi:hypothetical protein